MAIMRCACTDQARSLRLSKQAGPKDLTGQMLCIDGYNQLTTIEVALGGGVVLVARDTLYRDIAGLHGTWRRVEETVPAIQMIGQVAMALGVTSCAWYLDRPVSNSGRLAEMIRDVAVDKGWNWTVEIVNNPDAELAKSPHVIATADGVIIERCRSWFGLAGQVISAKIPDAYVVNLG